MERTARDLGDNKYEIRLIYYLYEEENLIRNIISLGPYVKVASPQRIADEVIRRVKKSIEMYMEKKHLRRIHEKFGDILRDKKVIIMGISDDYTFMNEELIEILKSQVSEYIDLI